MFNRDKKGKERKQDSLEEQKVKEHCKTHTVDRSDRRSGAMMPVVVISP